MTRLSHYELLLYNLVRDPEKNRFVMGCMPKEDAYAELKRETGEDFGYDFDAWAQWLDENMEGWRFHTAPRDKIGFGEEVVDIIDALLFFNRPVKPRKRKRSRQ